MYTQEKLATIQCGVAFKPFWYDLPEQQLREARTLWPNLDLPEPPMNFVSQTKTEVLLLHVPHSLRALRNLTVGPKGYTLGADRFFTEHPDYLRLTPDAAGHDKPVWVGFDPEFGRGDCPDKFWGQPNLAADEVFSALILLPNWPLAWGEDAPAPALSGYQGFNSATFEWSLVPIVNRYSNSHMLRVEPGSARVGDDYRASPRVRVC